MDHRRTESIDGLINMRSIRSVPSVEQRPIPTRAFGSERYGTLLDSTEGFEAGVASLGAGHGEALSDRHELIVVTHGVLNLHADNQFTVSAGDCVAIPKGAMFGWSAPKDVSWIYASQSQGEEIAGASPLPIALKRPTGPCAPPPAELVLQGTPVWHQDPAFVSPSGKFGCGTWDTSAYRRDFTVHPRHELMYLLEGNVDFIARGGEVVSFQSGDILLMIRGTETSWSNPTYVSKVYCNLK